MSPDQSDEGIQEDNDTSSESNEGYLNLIKAYKLGLRIQFIEFSEANNPPFVVKNYESSSGMFLKGVLESMIEILENSDLEAHFQSDVEAELDKLSEEYLDESSDSEVESEREEDQSDEVQIIRISNEDAESLQHSARTWDRLLREELHDAARYPPIESAVIKIEDLLESPELLFDDMHVWEDLPEQVRDDLSQSIKSLSFSSPTGSVFLALRAVEDRMREWYETETGSDIEDRTFGQVISELDDHYDESEKPLILTHLSYLKDRRNEVAHPNRSPTVREAESTLVNVRETIYNIEEVLANSQNQTG